MKAMKACKVILLIVSFTFVTSHLFAQYQEQQPQKTPTEMASEQADRLQRDLNLKDHQLFFVDSVLQFNFVGLSNEVNQMKAAGMQTMESYRAVQTKWAMKTEEAFEKILDNEQFIRYLKVSGRYRDYKKRKGIK
jgi:hypothetical protein